MMVQKRSDHAWFAAKKFGYGSGLPIAWQGWVFLAMHVAVISLGVFALKDHPLAAVAWALIFSLLPSPLYAAKTRGGWKWRSGDGD